MTNESNSNNKQMTRSNNHDNIIMVASDDENMTSRVRRHRHDHDENFHHEEKGGKNGSMMSLATRNALTKDYIPQYTPEEIQKFNNMLELSSSFLDASMSSERKVRTSSLAMDIAFTIPSPNNRQRYRHHREIRISYPLQVRPSSSYDTDIGTLFTIAPQDYLDAMIFARGYSTKRYQTIDGGYYNDPTPLQQASYHPHLLDLVNANDIVTLRTLFTQCGLSSNPCDADGTSLLHHTCSMRNVKCFTMLLLLGGDVRIANRLGRTPLHHACQSSSSSSSLCLPMIEAIMKRDLRLFYMADRQGKLPLECIPKQHWTTWNHFLTAKMDRYWPMRNYAQYGEERPPRLTRRPPNSRPYRDPKAMTSLQQYHDDHHHHHDNNHHDKNQRTYFETLRLIASGAVPPYQHKLSIWEHHETVLRPTTATDRDRKVTTTNPTPKLTPSQSKIPNKPPNGLHPSTGNGGNGSMLGNSVSTADETIDDSQGNNPHDGPLPDPIQLDTTPTTRTERTANVFVVSNSSNRDVIHTNQKEFVVMPKCDHLVTARDEPSSPNDVRFASSHVVSRQGNIQPHIPIIIVTQGDHDDDEIDMEELTMMTKFDNNVMTKPKHISSFIEERLAV